jgi:hypothetical protein
MAAQPRIKYSGSRTAHQCEIDGKKFASKGEAERYLELSIAWLDGKILEFMLQPRFEIQPAFDKNGEHYRKIEYFADFKVVHLDGHIIIEDVKGWRGFTTPEFKMKKKLVEFRYPHISIQEVRRAGKEKTIAALMATLTKMRS